MTIPEEHQLRSLWTKWVSVGGPHQDFLALKIFECEQKAELDTLGFPCPSRRLVENSLIMGLEPLPLMHRKRLGASKHVSLMHFMNLMVAPLGSYFTALGEGGEPEHRNGWPSTTQHWSAKWQEWSLMLTSP